MSKKNGFFVAVAVITLGLGLLVLASAAPASVYYWDSTASSGTWSTSMTAWSTSTTSGATLAWPSSGTNDAYFYGSHSGGESIAASGNLTVGNITFAGTTYTISGGTLTLAASSGTSTITTSYNSTIGSVLAGTVALTKSGAADLILTGSDTYSGATTISTGTLQIGSGGTTGSIGKTSGVSNSGVLEFDNTSGETFAPVISGGGALVQAAGTLILTGSDTYSGATTISGGTLQLGSGGTTGSINSTSITDNSVLTFDRSDSSMTFSQAVSGTGGLLQAGTGILILTGSNAYSGATTISGGTLQLGSGGTMGSINSTSITDNGVLTFDRSDSSMTFSQAVNGTGGLLQAGTGILILTGSNAYSGATTISGGTLQLGSGGATGSIGKTSGVSNSGVLEFDNTSGETCSPVISGSGALVQAAGTLILTGSNTYSGATTISAGTLQVGSGGSTGSIGNTSGVSNSGVLEFDNTSGETFSPVISGGGALVQAAGLLILTGSDTYSGATTISAGTLQVGTGGTTGSIGKTSGVSDGGVLAFSLSGNTAFALAITGGGGLTQMGPGALTLTGSNSYAGGTTVAGGILQFTGNSAVPDSGTITIDAGAALTLAPSGTYSTVTGWLSSGKIAAASAGAVALIASSSEAISMSGYASLSLGASGSVTYSGILTPSGTTYNLGGGGGTLTFTPSITGAASLNVGGPGAVVLTGGNTYTGGTTVGGGVLQFNEDSAVPGSGTITIDAGAALALDPSGTYSTVTGWLGSGKIAAASAGAVALIASSGETINMGGYPSLSLGASGSVTYCGTLTPSGTTYNLGGGGGTLTFTPSITGAASLNVSGPGAVVLASTHSYTGATFVTAGTLQVYTPSGPSPAPIVHFNMDGAIGTIPSTFTDLSGSGNTGAMGYWGQIGSGYAFSANPGQVYAPGHVGQGVFFNTAASNEFIGVPVSATLSTSMSSWTNSMWINIPATLNSSRLYFFSARFQPLPNSGQNNYGTDEFYDVDGAGNGTIGSEIAGVDSSGNPGWTALASNAATLTPGTWHMITTTVTPTQEQVYVDGQLLGTDTINASYTPQLITTSSDILGVGIMQNGFEQQLPASADEFNLFNYALTAAQVNQLYLINVGNLPGTTPVRIGAAGVLDLAGANQTIASLSDNGPGGGGVVTNSNAYAATLTLALSGGSTTFSGVIQNGAGQTSLTLNGAGAQVLTGSSTYTGQTTINGGTLQIGSGGTTGSINSTSGVVLGSGGVLAFNRSDVVNFPQVVSGSGGVQQMGPGRLVFTGDNTYAGPTIITGGTLQATFSMVPALIHYTFDGPLGPIAAGTTIPDASGNGINLTVRDSGASYTPGRFGQSISMSSGVYMYTPAVSALVNLNSWTTSIWISIPSAGTASNQGLVATTNPDTNGFEEFYDASDHSVYFCVLNNQNSNWVGYGEIALSSALSPNTWHMITATVAASGLNLYVDGQYVGNQTNLINAQAWDSSQTPQFMNADSNFNVGEGTRSGWQENCSLDEFNLYSSVLSPVQIARLYTNQLNVVGIPSTSAVQMGTGVLDLAGVNQTVASLADAGAGRGTVTSSAAGAVTLTIAPPCGSTTTFSGVIQDGTSGGTLSVLLAGSGTQVFAGVNTYSGGTTIQSGILSITNDDNLGGTNGALAITGGTLQSTGAVTLSSTRTVTLGAGAGVNVASGALIYAGGIANAGIATGALTKTGTGVLQLDGKNTYTGPTTVNLGTLSGTGTLAGTVTVNASAHLAPGDNVSGNFGGAGNFTAAGLTLNSGADVDFDLGAQSDLLIVTGALALNGATINVQSSGGLGLGLDEIISYGSLPGGLNAGSLLVGSLPAGYCAGVVNNASLKQIALNMLATETWTGASSSAWNTSTGNWSVTVPSSGTATYNDGTEVYFDDTARTGSVTVAGTVSPLVLVVSNGTLSYTFSGSGTIAGGAALVKSGAGTLAMNMAGNTYTGGTTLNAGVLQVGASSTVSRGVLTVGPLGTGTLSLNGGTLQDDGTGRAILSAVEIGGNVTLASAGSGGLTFGPSNNSGTLTTANTMTITGAPTITVAAPTTIADTVCGNLNVMGPNTLTLTAASNSLTGTTQVGGGGTLVGTVANMATAPIILSSGSLVFAQQTSGTISQPISGAGSLTMTGNGTLAVNAPLTYTGPTSVLAGTVQLRSQLVTPVASYNFAGMSGSELSSGTVVDTSGNGHAMLLNSWGGGGTFVAGPLGNPGLTFPGGGFNLYTPTSSAFALTSWTDSVWIMPNSKGYFIDATNQLNTPGFASSATNSGITAYIGAQSGGWIAQGLSVPISLQYGTWYMMTQTVTAGQYQVYVNGALTASQTLTAGTPLFTNSGAVSSLWIGSGDYDGSVADFNLYSGVLTPVQIQQLYISNAAQMGNGLPSNTPVVVNRGATLDLAGLWQTIPSLSDGASGGGTVTSNTASGLGVVTLNLQLAGGTTTFSGVIQDGAGGEHVALTLNGTGTQVLTGSNTYTGVTTINSGLLMIAGSGVYSGGFALNGGTLEVTGPGAVDNAGPFTGSGGVVLLAPGGSMIARSYSSNLVVTGGTLTGATGATPALGGVLVSAGVVSLSAGQTMAVGNGGLLIAPGAGATVNISGGLLVQGGFGAGSDWWGSAVSVGDPGAGGPGGANNPAVLNISGGTLQAGTWTNGVAGAGLQVGVGGASGIVNQSGGVVNVEGWDAFAVGGAIFGATSGTGTYYLSGGTLNTGYLVTGFTEIGVAGGTGTVNVSGGVWNISADAPSGQGPGGQGGASLLNIGSGNAPDGDAPGAGSVVITGGRVNAFGGITIGNVYNRGGVGLLSLQGGQLDLTAGTAGALGGMILVGSGGTLTAGGGTLQNVNQILGNATLSGTVASGTPMPLSTSGTGVQTLVLAGVNNYTGGTIIQGGVVQLDGNNTSAASGFTVSAGALSGAGTAAGAVTVAAGAHLAPGDNAAGANFGGVGALTIGGLTLNSGANLDMDLGAAQDLVAVNGALDLEGGLLNVQAGSGFQAANYELISYTGSLSGASLSPGNMPPGYCYTIVDNPAGYPGSVWLDVLVLPPGPLTWTGKPGSAWGINTTANWSISGAAADYSDGAAVAFDDTAAGHGSVSIAGTVQPSAITVNNTGLPYVFSGAGSIAGAASLTKSGAGSLEINMAGNTYAGGTSLIAGVLQVDASSTVSGGTLAGGPLGTGAIAISGGTLQAGGSGATLANALTISGNAGLAGVTLAPSGLSTPYTVTLTNSPTLTVTAPVTIAEGVSGNLVMAGPSVLTLTAAANSLSGTTQVSGGTLVGTAANIATPVSLSNSANVTYTQQTSGTLNQPVSGAGSLSMAGPAMLLVTAAQGYTGLTTIAGGTLELGNGGSINSSSGVLDNGVLEFNLPGTTTFSKSISGSGSLVQAGGGVLTLTGSDMYTGGSEVSDGTLDFADPPAVPTGGIINISRPGAVNLLGLLAEIPKNQIVVAPDAAVEPAASTLPAVGSRDGGVAPASVPEPSTLMLLGIGAAIGFLWRCGIAQKKGTIP
jgi:autotransporter-associated beta strand protein